MVEVRYSPRWIAKISRHAIAATLRESDASAIQDRDFGHPVLHLEESQAAGQDSL